MVSSLKRTWLRISTCASGGGLTESQAVAWAVAPGCSVGYGVCVPVVALAAVAAKRGPATNRISSLACGLAGVSGPHSPLKRQTTWFSWGGLWIWSLTYSRQHINTHIFMQAYPRRKMPKSARAQSGGRKIWSSESTQPCVCAAGADKGHWEAPRVHLALCW